MMLVHLVATIAVMATILPVDEDTDTVRKLMRNKRNAADFSLVNDGNRESVVEVLRAIADREVTQIGHSSMSARSAEVLLLGLGDIPTIERQIEVYQEYKGRDAWQHIPQNFEWSKQPLIIPYLAEDLFLPGSVMVGVGFSPSGEVLIPNRSTYSGLISLRIIEASSEFSDEMKEWARQTIRFLFKDRNAFREQMRTWWKQNEEHFKQQDYAAVQPLQPEPAGTPAATPAPTPAPSPTAEPSPSATPGSAATAFPERSPVPTPAPKIETQQNRSLLWAVAGLALLTLGAAAAWFVRRQR